PHTRTGARLHEINGSHTTEVMALTIARKVLLVRAPPHLARLRPLTDEAVDRPGIHELARPLGDPGQLTVTLRNVHDLDTQLPRQLAPVGPGLRVARIETGILRNVEKRGFDEVRHQARIRTVSHHRRRRAGVAGA